MEAILENLIQNSKSSQFACIEIHNKPVFPFRYELCAILNINSWELIFKAYILKYFPEVKVIYDNGTTKPFDECLAFVSSELGNSFIVAKHNIEKVYEYRCNSIHFYQDGLDVLLYSLLSKNILVYHTFLTEHFNIDIANEANLVLLPIGFKKPLSPIDFLSNESMIQNSSDSTKSFIKSIIESTEQIMAEGLDDSILWSFKMALINENRIKNADIIAGITKNPVEAKVAIHSILNVGEITKEINAKTIRIEEETLFNSLYIYEHRVLLKKVKERIPNFKAIKEVFAIINSLKENPEYHKMRYLNVHKPKGGQGFYTESALNEIERKYLALIKDKQSQVVEDNGDF